MEVKKPFEAIPVPFTGVKMTPEEVLRQWKLLVQRGIGIKRETKLVEKAHNVKRALLD